MDKQRPAADYYKHFIECSNLGTWEWNVQTGETVFNQRWAEILGYTLEELQPLSIKTWTDRVHPEDLKKSDELLTRHFSGELPFYEIDCRMRHKDGRWIWVRDRGRLVSRTETGEPWIMLGTHADITETKTAEITLKASEERLRTIIETLPDPFFLKDLDSRFQLVNEATCRAIGKPREFILGRTDLEVYENAEAARALMENDKKVQDTGAPQILEETLMVGGTVTTYLSTKTPLRDPEGRLVGVVGVARDISDRKTIEKELTQSRRLLLASLESPQGMIIMAIDQDYRYLFFNATHSAAMQFAYGQTVEVGMNVLDCITSPEDRIKAKRNYDRAFAGETHSTIEIFGEVNPVYYESFYSPIRDENQKVIGVTAYALDITQRKKAETALLESEKKYSSLFNSMLEGFALHEIICDTSGQPVDYRFLDMNPAFEQITGLNRAEVLGKTVLEIMPATELTWIQKYGAVALTGQPISFENYSGALGRHFHVVAFRPKENQFAVIFSDVTDRKQAEEAIIQEKERLAVTLRSIGDGVITTDTAGRVTMMNKVAEELTGWKLDEAQGLPLGTVFHIIHQSTRLPHENPVEKVLNTGQIIELANHTLLIAKDGTERIIADSGAPIKDKTSKTIGVVLVFRDMTEKHKILDNLQKVDKLEALSILAGGIAHDFNNLLGGIFGFIHLAKERAAPDSLVSTYLDKALGVFERTKNLTQQLLTFSKGGNPIRKLGHLGKLLKENSTFVLSGTNVNCDFQIDPDLWLADYDENQIGQVIDNLVINAHQAMPEGGTITLKAHNLCLKTPEGLLLEPGDYIKISIQDTGTGIPPHLLKRIFDPFFTTKPRGNGLGLATCFSIVEKHDGFIDVESVPGQGSTFTVYLPAKRTGGVQAPAPAGPQHQGKGTILVMDDEDYMREIVAAMLESMGYSTLQAENGTQALELCAEIQKKGLTLRGALFDLTIPGGMGGKESIVRFKELLPQVPVFAASGFSEDPVMSRPTDFGFTASIRKPLKKPQLAHLLQTHLP